MEANFLYVELDVQVPNLIHSRLILTVSPWAAAVAEMRGYDERALLVKFVIEWWELVEGQDGVCLYAQHISLAYEWNQQDISVHLHDVSEHFLLLDGDEGCH